MDTAKQEWPALPLDSWRSTCDTLHLWTQILGKIRLGLAPPEPEWNHVTLYVTARGLTTSPMPYGERTFEIAFDFIMHKLVIAVSDSETKFIDLVPRSVAAFYAEVMKALHDCGIDVQISEAPQEVPDPIPFTKDEVHASYDREWVEKFFHILVNVDMSFRRHRAPFHGRHTPTQFWWGTFDFGYERFSGRLLTPPPGVGLLRRVGMDAEQINAGFWPGDARFPEPAFFAYAYPKPDGLEAAAIKPAAAFWSKEMGEFVLRYEDVRRSPSPRDAIREFLTSTYDAAATLAHWDPALKGVREPQ
jgi:hypothetical protein